MERTPAMHIQAKLNFHEWKAAEMESRVLGIDGKRMRWPKQKAGAKPATATKGKSAGAKGAKPSGKARLSDEMRRKIEIYAKRTKKKGTPLGQVALDIAARAGAKIDQALADEIVALTSADPDFMFGAMMGVKMFGPSKKRR